jgi:hypothetical protein
VPIVGHWGAPLKIDPIFVAASASAPLLEWVSTLSVKRASVCPSPAAITVSGISVQVHERCAGVLCVVQPDAGESRSGQHIGPGVGHVVRVRRVAKVIDDDVTGARAQPAEPQLKFVLPFAFTAQRGRQISRHRQRANTIEDLRSATRRSRCVR